MSFTGIWTLEKIKQISERITAAKLLRIESNTSSRSSAAIIGRLNSQMSCYAPVLRFSKKKSGAVRGNPETGELSLHSPLFRSAILLNIILNMKKNDEVYTRVNRIREQIKPKELS